MKWLSDLRRHADSRRPDLHEANDEQFARLATWLVVCLSSGALLPVAIAADVHQASNVTQFALAALGACFVGSAILVLLSWLRGHVLDRALDAKVGSGQERRWAVVARQSWHEVVSAYAVGVLLAGWLVR